RAGSERAPLPQDPARPSERCGVGVTSVTERPFGELSDMKEKVGDASAFLKKMSNPDRLLVCCALVEGERSVRDLEEVLGIRQPGLSQQIAELREAGLIAG